MPTPGNNFGGFGTLGGGSIQNRFNNNDMFKLPEGVASPGTSPTIPQPLNPAPVPTVTTGLDPAAPPPGLFGEGSVRPSFEDSLLNAGTDDLINRNLDTFREDVSQDVTSNFSEIFEPPERDDPIAVSARGNAGGAAIPEVPDAETRDTDLLREDLFSGFTDLASNNATELADLNSRIALNQLSARGAETDAATRREAARLGIAPGTPQFRQLAERNRQSLLSTGSNLISSLASQNLANERANLQAAAGFLQGQQGGDVRSQLALNTISQNPTLSTGQVNAIKSGIGDIMGQPGFENLPEQSQIGQITQWLTSLGVQNPEGVAEQMISASLGAQLGGLQGALALTGQNPGVNVSAAQGAPNAFMDFLLNTDGGQDAQAGVGVSPLILDSLIGG